MKQHSNQKPRPRGGRPPNQQQRKGNGGGSRNQTFDSNGPSVRIRGTAHQVMEKYLALARDAAGQDDRVLAENYLQHAEHYFRIIQSMQPRPPRILNPAAADGADGTPSDLDREDRRMNAQSEDGAEDEAGEGEDGAEAEADNDEAVVEVIRPVAAAQPAEEPEDSEPLAV